MDPEHKFKLQAKENTDRDKVRFNKRIFIYLFFLIISIIFWYLNALSKHNYADVHCKVNYQNFPKGKVLISELPASITLKVEGLGFQILKYKISSFYTSIDLNLNEFRIDVSSKNNRYDYYLLTRHTRDRINGMFSGVNVIKVDPDTLFFQFTDVVDKKVPIKALLNIQYEQQYMVHGNVIVIPDSIFVSGPKAIIDTLKFITTNEIRKNGIKDTFIAETELKPIPKFIIPRKSIKVFIPVEKFTEVIFNIPIETENIPEGIDIKTFPATVSLSCLVAVSDFEKMTPQMFRAVVDYTKIAGLKPDKVKVNLIKSPAQIYNVKFHPKTVEYIIEK